MNNQYLNTVRLMLSIAPEVFDSPHFAMKGGTAINMFVQDLPRLSVDIDVVMRAHEPNRDEALAIINAELARAKTAIERQGYAVTVAGASGKNKGDDVKLLVSSSDAQVKVEVNYVFRGTLMPTVTRSVVPHAQELFRVDLEVPTLDDAELYGSKLVAALDRQHPRDIFDVQHMYDTLGMRTDIVDAFVAYLAGHNRPIHEVLFAQPHPLADEYEAGFVGMTVDEIGLDQLGMVQQRLHDELPCALTEAHRKFLLSLIRLEPEWSLMPYEHLQQLPAIRWKIENLKRLKARDEKRFADQEKLLEARFLSIGPR
ncbi:nucleotidyl transferase AbiEii/AbiGii toxin family protein [Burkholderia sp. Nafp2/4-1b]|uniref:nucleotidyl transferase AbiEii/AbiGii toxin family protein n=1 Tax=Burkholderia sp. Nafp2/4-1b TaxID=2116686 RepID=UPI000EF8D2CA|nr:nucleotidyl transferase AbiEii/AbiGii toxin family protein [Burkholderia sp. Nafp2/4-1b]RKT98691.1 nucleotidyl transferase AbiEii/AbiGii toxin family protein [Burkholderia sp. Nafp2/4-1b]